MDVYNPSARERLQTRETSGRYYFSGTPLTFGEMSRKLPSGKWERCLRPFVPVNGTPSYGRFMPDAERPVVCVTSLAEMAVFRALSHQSLHTNLPKRERRTGWRYEDGMPVYRATGAVLENVQRLRKVSIPLLSTVVGVRRTAAVFEQLPRELHQLRAYEPVPFETADVVDVTLDLWPNSIEECEPWPTDFNLDSYAPYDSETAQWLDELCAAEQDWLGSRLAVSQQEG